MATGGRRRLYRSLPADTIEARCLVELGVGTGVLSNRRVISVWKLRLVALRVQRRVTAFGRREGDLGSCILEDIVEGAASSSSQKPVLRPVLPSWS